MKPYKDITPTEPRVYITESEERIELPFHRKLENIAYIGALDHETWHVAAHYHDHFELCLVEEGSGWFALDELMYEVGKGDLFLTKPGEVHQGAASCGSPFRLSYMGFQCGEMRNLESRFYQLGSRRAVRDRVDDVKRSFYGIFDELHSDHDYSAEMVHGLFLQLLVSVLRSFKLQEEGQNSANKPLSLSPIITKVLDLIHTDGSYHCNIKGLAGRVNISRPHLDREFKICMGITIGNYIRSLCLDRAKHLLRESSESVTAISAKLQFDSIHKFSIFFKRHVGISPLAYRKS